MTDLRTNRTVRAGLTARPAASVNTWLLGAVVVLSLGQLFLLPLVLLPASASWGWALVTLPLMTTPFWSLVHEAIHGTLHPSRVRNDLSGRVLSVLYGAPFVLLKTGHLLHHRYSRTRRERVEIYDPARTSWARAAPAYYLRLFCGLYLLEVASVVLAALPARTLRALARRADSPDTVAGLLFERIAAGRNRSQFRLDALAVVVVYTSALLTYGAHFWMLLLAMFWRAVVVSVLDNAYHYGTTVDAPLEAMNLRLPMALERFALSFNLHDVHHRHPGLRWYELRPAFLAEGSPYHLGWFAATARQVRGPIKLENSEQRRG